MPVPNDPIIDLGSQAVILDTILVDRTSGKLGTYTLQEPGSPFKKGNHTADQIAKLDGNEFLGQKASKDTEWINRYWGKPPSTQNVANWESAYEQGAVAWPSFQRRYLEKRDTYLPRDAGSSLVGLYRIRVTNPGTGYLVAPTISFSSGGGSGGVAIAILDNSGRIARIIVKVEGTYTFAPTVVITPVSGGSGAAATAHVQTTSCRLTKEVVTNNAPSPYDSLYIVVTRLYETLASGGVRTFRYGFDSESGARTVTITEYNVLSDAVAVALGTVYADPLLGGTEVYCIDSNMVPNDGKGTISGTRVSLYMELPPQRTEYGSERAVCPALFTFIGGWTTSPVPPFKLAGPFAGVNYELTAKRTVVSTVTVFDYSVGAPASLPMLWQVVSPGAASRFFPISGDTIHNEIYVEEVAPDMSSQVVEDLPASTPDSYTPGQDMVLHASAKPYGKGGGVFYEKRVTVGQEAIP